MNKHITQGRHKFKAWKNSPWLMVTRRIKNRGGLWRCYWYNPLTGQFTQYMMEHLYYRAIGKEGKDSAYSLFTGDPYTENPSWGSPVDGLKIKATKDMSVPMILKLNGGKKGIKVDPFTFVRQARKYLSGAGRQAELFPELQF